MRQLRGHSVIHLSSLSALDLRFIKEKRSWMFLKGGKTGFILNSVVGEGDSNIN